MEAMRPAPEATTEDTLEATPEATLKAMPEATLEAIENITIPAHGGTLLIDASPEEDETRKVYIVLSQTGTALSRILKLITRAPYNHSSIALTEDLRTMYSFGRTHPYNPFHGGFVQESPDHGTFKRFKNTKVMVLEAEITQEAYSEVGQLIREMVRQKALYHYNYWGLLLAGLHIPRKKRNCYYCSEFVKAMVLRMELPGAEEIPDIVKPMHFLTVPHRTVYVGKLREYAPPNAKG